MIAANLDTLTKSEALNAEQKSLIEETIDTDLAALALQIERRAPSKGPSDKQVPKRAVPPPICRASNTIMSRRAPLVAGVANSNGIGEDAAEKLDYTPGVFTVERHVRGKWVCTKCETLVQAPVPAHIIDKGIPTTGLLAQLQPLTSRATTPASSWA